MTTQAHGATAQGASRRDALARLLVFLRTELAPSPARYRATVRIVVACLIATAITMTFRVPYGHWLIITIFIVSQPNVGASIDKAILRFAGTLVGAAGVVVTVVAFPQAPWVFVPMMAFLIGLGVFLSRTTAYPYVALLGTITVVLFLGGAASHPATSITDGLWRVAVIVLADVIVTVVQLFVLPDDPEKLLLDDFVRILGHVERRLGRLADPGAAPGPSREESARLRDAAFNGLARHIDLLTNAETRYRTLRSRHTEQLVLIGSVNRLAMGSLTLESLLAESPGRERDLVPGDALQERIAALATSVSRLRAALAARRTPRPNELTPAPSSEPRMPPPRDAAFLPPLREMERAIAEIAPAMAFLDGERATGDSVVHSPLEETGTTHFFTPACSLSNTRDLRFAAQVTLAAMICYLIVVGLHWPGIFTALVTCVIVGQGSFGATVQKAWLRLAGAVVGALLGFTAILVVVPNIDTLPPFLIVIAVCSAIAGYVATGSARTSYIGVQIAFSFALALLDTWGPSIGLTGPRDRVIGVLLGNVAVAAVMFWLWPVLASREMVKSLESALRHMATLSRLGVSGAVQPVVRPARGFRLQIFQDLATTMRLHGEAQFEPGGGTPATRAQQQRLLDLLLDAQQVFLVVAGFVRNRLNVELGRIDLPTRQSVRAIALAIGPNLEAAADALAGRVPRPAPDLASLVTAAEDELEAEIASSADLPGAARGEAELRSQLELYRNLVPQLERLALHARAAGAGASVEAGEATAAVARS